MKTEDIDTKLGRMDVPVPEQLKHQQELKIPLLSYKKSSKAGLWLLIIPAVVAITAILKYELGIGSPVLDAIKHFFSAVDENPVFTYLIPLIFVGFPFLAMILNLMAICHVAQVAARKEILITIKVRPLNIALLLCSFAIFVYFLLPDKLSF